MLTLAFYLLSLIIVLTYTTCIFFIAQMKKNNSIIDIAYGLGFIVTAFFLITFKIYQGPLSPYTVILFVLILVWGLRLSTRIYRKNRNKKEDFRYLSWRNEWSKKGYVYFLARSYLQIFILQGVIISIVLLPFTVTLGTAPSTQSGILLGLFIWIIGFCFEATGDHQLDTFIRNPHPHKGTIMKTGLWKFTRHPNYFGESTMWFGLACIAITSGASYIALLSPLLITYLLLYVSGIPMLEKKWDGIPEWEAYKKKTSAFFPLPPKK